MIDAAITSFRGAAVALLGLAAVTHDAIDSQDSDPPQLAVPEPILDGPPMLAVVEPETIDLCINAAVSVSGFRIRGVDGSRYADFGPPVQMPIGGRFYVAELRPSDDGRAHGRYMCDCMGRCVLDPADVTVIAAAKDRAEAETMLAWLRFAELPTRVSH